MRPLIICVAAVLVAITGIAVGQPVSSGAPNEVLVKFRALTPGVLQQLAQDEDLDLAKGVGGNGVLRFRSRSKNTDALIANLRRRGDVLYVEPNAVLSAIGTPNDPSYTSLWGMPKISAPTAWNTSTGSQGAVVGVIDSGVDYTHPDLAANIWSAPAPYAVTIGSRILNCPAGSHGYNAIRETCDPMDDNNHGTHVSGTIGAVGNNGIGVVGVNWKTSIVGIKFLGASGSGYTSDAIDGIEFAIQLKSKLEVNIRVLSNSWGGGGRSQSLLDEINRANSFGILFVAAAGNDGRNTDSTPSYPASYDAANIVSVAATDSSDQLASWSNYGTRTVDLAAPGVGILSTVPGNRYATYSGTSMATPHVSGAAALILSACPTLDAALLKSVLLTNVDHPFTLSGKVGTGGRLNAAAAMSACGGTVSPDFTINASPTSQKMAGQGTASYSVNLTTSGGFSESVSLTPSGCPAGATCTLSSPTVSPGSTDTLTVQADPSVARGTYTLTIIGTTPTKTRTTTVTLVVSKR